MRSLSRQIPEFSDSPRDESQGPAASAAITRDSSDEDECSGAEEAISSCGDDEREEKLIDDFLARGCGCILGPK